MRLLNSSTLRLEEFADDAIPRYAILSHTWGQEEILSRDMQADEYRCKAGYKKLKF